MESAECSVPLAPRLLMKTTLRVMRTHRATTTAPASQERRKGFCSDSIRTSHMVEAGSGGQPSEHPPGAFDNVLPLGSVLDHGPIPERVKQIPGVWVVSVLRRAPSRPTMQLVDPRGFEPLTFWLPARRGSTVCELGKRQVGGKRRHLSYPLTLSIGEPSRHPRFS